jgi:hypothetical protein
MADPERISQPDIRRRDRLGGIFHEYQMLPDQLG